MEPRTQWIWAGCMTVWIIVAAALYLHNWLFPAHAEIFWWKRWKRRGKNECGRSYNAISIIHNTDAVCYLSSGRSAHRRRYEKESLRVPCLFTYLHRVYNFYVLVLDASLKKRGFFIPGRRCASGKRRFYRYFCKGQFSDAVIKMENAGAHFNKNHEETKASFENCIE